MRSWPSRRPRKTWSRKHLLPNGRTSGNSRPLLRARPTLPSSQPRAQIQYSFGQKITKVCAAQRASRKPRTACVSPAPSIGWSAAPSKSSDQLNWSSGLSAWRPRTRLGRPATSLRRRLPNALGDLQQSVFLTAPQCHTDPSEADQHHGPARRLRNAKWRWGRAAVEQIDVRKAEVIEICAEA